MCHLIMTGNIRHGLSVPFAASPSEPCILESPMISQSAPQPSTLAHTHAAIVHGMTINPIKRANASGIRFAPPDSDHKAKDEATSAHSKPSTPVVHRPALRATEVSDEMMDRREKLLISV